MNARKVYVRVLAEFDEQGSLMPVNITWEDGRKYEIDRVLDVRRAVATKVGGTAVRYTVSINGRTTFIFYDDGKWFAQSKQ